MANNESAPRDYTEMTMCELVETIIRDSKEQGSLNYPLRTEGYHRSSNLLYTERLSY